MTASEVIFSDANREYDATIEHVINDCLEATLKPVQENPNYEMVSSDDDAGVRAASTSTSAKTTRKRGSKKKTQKLANEDSGVLPPPKLKPASHRKRSTPKPVTAVAQPPHQTTRKSRSTVRARDPKRGSIKNKKHNVDRSDAKINVSELRAFAHVLTML